MFSLPTIHEKSVAERNRKRLALVEEALEESIRDMESAIARVTQQIAGLNGLPVNVLGLGEVQNLAQHGGYMNDHIGRAMRDANTSLLKASVLCAGFEVAHEPQS